jgi:hypothetical protein
VFSQTESKVCRPDIGLVVVLDERLEVHRRSEAEAHAPLGQVGDEASVFEVDVVAGPGDGHVQLGAVAQVDRRLERYPIPGVEPAGVEPPIVVDPGALVGVPPPGELGVVVGPGRDDDSLRDLERDLQALEAHVHRRAEERAVLEVHV